MGEIVAIRPQKGPQERFLASTADIAIFGGAAGGGKSWALLLDPLRYVDVAGFQGVIFRRNATQVRNPGGLWDESLKLFPRIGGHPIQQPLEWIWPAAKIKMAHLEHENTVFEWQGAQLAWIGFDELTHFSANQFWYLLSRLRTMCGIKPCVRATCNPDADSWVARLIEWWIDGETGQPIAERSGVVRWFVRINDKLLWADSRDEAIAKYGRKDLPPDHQEQVRPKSLTFIPSRLTDNQALMTADPDYMANLMALPYVERERLLGGNWKIRPAAGLYFRRDWVQLVDAAPAGLDVVRYWDLAATEKTDANDPDFTVGVKLGRDPQTGMFYVLHGVALRASPFQVEAAIVNTANHDGQSVRLGLPQDPGQAGKAQAQYMVQKLAGYTVGTRPERGDKITRFGPFSAQCEAGNVRFLRGPWNDEFFTALEGFPDALHDDHADACAGAFGMFVDSTSGVLDYYRQQVAAQQAAKAGEAA